MIVLAGIFLVRRLLRGGGPPPLPVHPTVRFIHETDPGVQEIDLDGPQPADLDIHIGLEKDPGQPVIEIEDSNEP